MSDLIGILEAKFSGVMAHIMAFASNKNKDQYILRINLMSQFLTNSNLETKIMEI